MITRRKFVKNMAVGTAGVYAANSMFACSAPVERRIENLGYITGILGRSLREGDWQAILRQTAEMGYTEIETGNYMGESLPAFRAFLSDIGLKAVAAGIRWTDDMDVFERSLDFHNDMDINLAISYWPYFGGPPFGFDDYKRAVDILSKMGEICKNRGLALCWHNHDIEFFEVEGVIPFDYIMQQTDEDLVKCQLDIYWVKKGGADPMEMLRKYSGRYPMLHIKDMAPGEEQDFACPGEGIIDWKEIFSEAYDQGIRHFSVERDGAEDGLECLRVSAEHLLALRF